MRANMYVWCYTSDNFLFGRIQKMVDCIGEKYISG